MTTSYIDDALLTGIANAIRGKNGSSDHYTPSQMATAISNIPTGGGGYTLSDIQDVVKIILAPASSDKTLSAQYLAKCVNLRDYALRQTTLASIEFTNVQTVGQYAFAYSSQLVYVDFSSQVLTTIGNYAFRNCTSLTHIIIRRTDAVVTLTSGSSFASSNNLTNIYVPDALVESYKTATNWSTHASKITKLSDLPS